MSSQFFFNGGYIFNIYDKNDTWFNHSGEHVFFKTFYDVNFLKRKFGSNQKKFHISVLEKNNQWHVAVSAQ